MFRCKQFSIDDSLAAMKVSTDALILGSWAKIEANPKPSQRILDIGSGSGILTLMMLQKSAPNGLVEAIDVDVHAVQQTKVNVESSPWTNRAQVFNQSITEFCAEPYDVIISNPPYFSESQNNANQLMSAPRRTARHQGDLTWSKLCEHMLRLSHATTDIFVMYPYSLSDSILNTASEFGLILHNRLSVKHAEDSECYLSLFHFSMVERSQTAQADVLVIRQEKDYSDAFKALCKDFYLRF
jgi:tRNA1Val (adenine37-N6)-methyltransferase